MIGQLWPCECENYSIQQVATQKKNLNAEFALSNPKRYPNIFL